MTITCSQCGARMQVDESLIGQQVACPSCGAAVEVAAGVGALQAAPVADAAGPGGSAPMLRIVMLAGAGLFFVAFFLPWWSFSMKETEAPDRPKEYSRDAMKKHEADMKAFQQEMEKVSEATSDNAGWYIDHVGARRSSKKGAMLFGWNTGTGITAFIFSFIIAAFVLLPWFLKFLQGWAWIGQFASAIMAVPIFILSLVWWFASPGEDVEPYLSQGVIVGPFVTLAGSVALIAGGLILGICGLKSFITGLKGAPAGEAPVAVAAEAAPPPAAPTPAPPAPAPQAPAEESPADQPPPAEEG